MQLSTKKGAKRLRKCEDCGRQCDSETANECYTDIRDMADDEKPDVPDIISEWGEWVLTLWEPKQGASDD